MKDCLHQIQNFFSYAEDHKNDVILYSGLSAFTYGDFLSRYKSIRESVFRKQNGNVLVVSMSDCVALFLHYLAAVEAGIDCLFLPLDSDEIEQKNIRDLLKMRGKLPFEDAEQIRIPQSENHSVEGEVIFQTSGTTGTRRFVRISHDDFFRKMMVRYEYDCDQEDGVKLLLIPIWKQPGMKELLRSLFFGEKICVLNNLNMPSIIECLAHYKFTSIILKSSTLPAILYDRKFKKEYLSKLRILRYCQEPLLYETMIQMQSLFPNVKFYSDYGLTETIGTIAVMGPSIHLKGRKEHYLPATGKFLPGVEVKIIDQEKNDVRQGEVGELIVHSPEQYRGYLGGEESNYWVMTGDMGWLDSDGFFNLSGFHLLSRQKGKGSLFVLPALARKQFVNIPMSDQINQRGKKEAEAFEIFMWLIHASLNIDEIRHLYLDMIPGIVKADAYGFEMFQMEPSENSHMMPIDQFWYQDALELTRNYDIVLIDRVKKEQLSLRDLETFYGDAVNILYMPLYSMKAQMHAVISFARVEKKGKFSSLEITLLKQVSHHLNLALLNARTIQEIQSRHIALRNAIDISDIGIILSDLTDTIYYMNSVIKRLIEIEDVSELQNSSLLEHFKENIFNLYISGKSEYTSQFIFYYRENSKLSVMNIRSVLLDKEKRNAASFISQNLDMTDITFGDLGQNLSEKEREVLTCLCHGFSYREIADQLFVSINTINYHVKNIYRKMKVNSRNELLNNILYLGRNGFQFSSEDAIH